MDLADRAFVLAMLWLRVRRSCDRPSIFYTCGLESPAELATVPGEQSKRHRVGNTEEYPK